MSLVLSPFSQQLLWEQVIFDWLNEQTKYEYSFLDPSLSLSLNSWLLAYSAREAFAIIQIYQLSLGNLKQFCLPQETQIFLEWMNRYINICNKYTYISNFIDFNFKDLSKFNFNLSNKVIELHNSATNVVDCFKMECQDFTEEIINAARFSLSKFDKSKSVGVIIFDLESNYNKINYIFSNYFDEQEYEICFHQKLTNNYSISIALLILDLANSYITNKKIIYDDFSKLFKTKYILGGLEELIARSYVDYFLRSRVDYKFDFEYIVDQLLQSLTLEQSNTVKIFIQLCCDFKNFIDNNNLNVKYRSDYWVKLIKEILDSFGWCKENLNNQELAIVDSWLDLLEEYKALHDLIDPHDFAASIEYLIKLSGSYRFAKKELSIEKNKVIILDLKQALNQKFDYLWICGCSATELPLEPKFNSFLPIWLQKNIKLISGSLLLYSDLSFKQFLEKLISNTSITLICSYSLFIEENQTTPSKFISYFIPYPNFDNEITASQKVNDNFEKKFKIEPELYIDHFFPEYSKKELSGIKVFKLQDACPFQAAIKIRFNIDNLQIMSPYLEHSTKGKILHKTLAGFWLKCKNSKFLKRLSQGEIKRMLFKIVYKIFFTLQKQKPATLNKFILRTEIDNMVNICFTYITKYDLNRSDFKIIGVEQKMMVKLKDYLVSIIIDRIDQLPNADLLIIDYKTSRSIEISDIKFDNPDLINDPQLIIYSLYSSAVKGLFVGKIRTEQVVLMGLLDQNFDLSILGNLPDLKYIKIDDWEQKLNSCYQYLYNLAYEFKKGSGIVDPKNGERTCKICNLQSLCRFYLTLF